MTTLTDSTQIFNQISQDVVSTSKAIRIFSRTNRVSAEVKLSLFSQKSDSDITEWYGIVSPNLLGTKVKVVLNGIKYGTATGRFHTSAQNMIDSLSGYQFTKLVLKLAFCSLTMQDTVNYINGKHAITF